MDLVAPLLQRDKQNYNSIDGMNIVGLRQRENEKYNLTEGLLICYGRW